MKWTNEQQDAIMKSGTNIIVSAGAGSGKTAVLTERVINKIQNGTSINRLLILTFTNLAAKEMKDRIRKSLKSINSKQLDNLEASYITTFDSFALSVVMKYHYLLNLSPNISIMDNSIKTLKTNEILDKIFEESYGLSNFDKLINDFCNKNDDDMKKIIKEINGKLDLLPNKKEYLTNYKYFESDFSYEIKKYNEILINKINNINDLYKNLVSLVDNKYIETFNLEPLLNSKNYTDIKNNLLKIGSPKKNKNCQDEYKIYKEEISEEIKKLKHLTRFNDIDEIKQGILGMQDYVKAIIDIILKFDLLFDEYKKNNNIFTFNDIAKLAIKLVKENEFVLNELKNSFDEIMIDEYQDTSNIQEEFISLISNNNLYMVGDIKQSIYQFRNANPSIFKNKYDKYSKCENGIKIDLLKNFRSREEVLNNINLIFNLIMDDEIGSASYKENHQMYFGNNNYLNKMDTNYNMDLLTYEKNETYKNEEIEAFIVANDILDKLKNYKVLDKNNLRNVTYSDFAIIMDRGKCFDLYKKIFEYLGIPIVQIKNEKLTLGDDIIAFKNLFNLVIKINLNEIDDEFKYLFTSVARSYLFKMNDEEIFDIIKKRNYAKTEIYQKCKRIDILETSNLDLINSIIEEFDFYKKLLTTNSINETLIRINYLKDLSINLANLGYTPIMFGKYLNEMVKENSIEYETSSNINAVKILNIHKSKGLEYNICYFTGLYKEFNNSDIKTKFLVNNNIIITPYIKEEIEENILKDIVISEEIKNTISEKIRLFYVALTRAKEKIIIVCPLENKTNIKSLVPTNERLKYKSFKSMLDSIYDEIKPYIKNINLNEINLTHEYDTIKLNNYQNKIPKTDKKIIQKNNIISYEEINTSKYSKSTNKLISKDEAKNMLKGSFLHYIFETEDFKTTNNPYVLRFLKHIDKNYINVYKEFEFIYEENNNTNHGIIDLILEYKDYIAIIDYKTKDISDENYIKQLNGYKNYIFKITNKNVKIFLYSIIEDQLIEKEG